MANTIRPESLQKQLGSILDEYEAEVKEVVKDTLPKVGKETVKELKKTSPKDRGRYLKTWKSKIEEDRMGQKLIVYNKDHYMLTHLLEHGHALVGGGRTEPREHIKPAQDNAVENVIKEVKRRLEE